MGASPQISLEYPLYLAHDPPKEPLEPNLTTVLFKGGKNRLALISFRFHYLDM
jgi:hypothetical protein